MDNVVDPTIWAQYGDFAGLVSLALFAVLFWILKEHKLERKENMDRHISERQEWRADISNQSNKVSGALGELTQAIRNKEI